MATSSFLSPPNSYSLSDMVIGGVVQRMGSLNTRLGLTNENDSREVSRYTKPRQDFLPPRSVIGHKRLHDFDSFDSLLDLASKRTSESSIDQVDTTVPPERKTISRRERCRINQARYRKRQRKYADDLNESIGHLREQIQDLETQRHDLLRSTPTHENIWVVATEYFHLFRYGYMTPTTAQAPVLSSFGASATEYPQRQTHSQLSFLKVSMATDVTDGKVCGVEALLNNWRLLSLYCGDVHMQLKRLEQVAADSLVASATTSITITNNTLRHVFPHLLVTEEDEEGKLVTKWSPLAKKLRNQRLEVCESVRFDWDASTGRVVRLETKTDLMTPMLQLLGNLDDVVQVFSNALMTLDGSFVLQ